MSVIASRRRSNPVAFNVAGLLRLWLAMTELLLPVCICNKLSIFRISHGLLLWTLSTTSEVRNSTTAKLHLIFANHGIISWIHILFCGGDNGELSFVLPRLPSLLWCSWLRLFCVDNGCHLTPLPSLLKYSRLSSFCERMAAFSFVGPTASLLRDHGCLTLLSCLL